MAAKTQGYGISAQDMEASRLVFVSVKGAKPRRKVAVPVPDGYSWQDFCNQVQAKLKLSGVQSVQLASTGETLTSIDDLQDIDELHVVEAAPPPPVIAASHIAAQAGAASNLEGNRLTSGSTATTTGPPLLNGHGSAALSVEVASDQGVQHAALHRHQSMQRHNNPLPGPELGAALTADAEGSGDDSKYVRRSSRMRRWLQPFLSAYPSLAQPALPVTTRDLPQAEARKGAAPARKRRRQQSVWNMRTFLSLVALMAFLAVMLLLYNRVSPRLPTIQGLR